MSLPSLGRVTATVTVTVRDRAVAALFLLVALALGGVQRAAAVPFASLSPPPALQLFQMSPSTTLCVLMASGRGVSSISAADLAPFAGRKCDRPDSDGGPLPFIAVDLSNNSLTALPDGLFSALATDYVRLVGLSRNRFTATGLDNFRSALAGIWTGAQLDLSFNDLGPAVPAAVAQWPGGGSTLLLIGCGITDVPANSFAGSSWYLVDLSLNNLRSGLHAYSFNGSSSLRGLFLSNCNLRSSSLVSGVFDGAVGSLYMDNLAADLSNGFFPYLGLSPKLPLDPRLLSFSALNSPGQPLTNQVTAARYLESWANFFAPFPAGVLYSSVAGSVIKQPQWGTLALGDVASVEPAFLDDGLLASLSVLTVTLAPRSVVAAMGIDPEAYCPLQSLMQGLSVPLTQTISSDIGLYIKGFDLPLPTHPLSAGCAFPDCAAMGGCRQLGLQDISLSTEPALLQRDVIRWAREMGLNGSRASVSFPSPPLDLWSPALNRSDWLPTDLLCDLDVSRVALPALPYSDDSTGLRMPFPLPAGLLRCLSNSTQLTTIDWQAARLFSSNMLAELPANHAITLKLNTEALYGGVRPVPVGFFDSLPSSVTVSGICGQSCARIASQCPYFVDGACQLCPSGSFKRVRAVLDQLSVSGPHAYCSSCPLGFYCDSTISPDPIPCPAGSYANSTGLDRCTPCSAGTFNVQSGSSSSAACQPCAPGKFSPAGSTQCVDCAAGTYSSTAGQSACDLCPTGTYSALTGRSDPVSCANCPPGRFNPTEGGSSLSSCQSCPPGRASNVPGAIACSLCQPGSFTANNASTECTTCPANTFQTLTGAVDPDFCLACPAEAPLSPPASVSLFQCTTGIVCEAGLYTTLGDQPCAEACPLGSACRSGKITPCAAGSYADREGMGSCTPCGAGSVGTKTGSQSASGCSLCPPSTYSSAAVSTACTPCAAGSFSGGRGATSASDCVAEPSCVTAESLAAGNTVGSSASLCATAGLQPIALSALLPDGANSVAAFMMKVGRLASQANATAATISAVFAVYKPEKSLSSLRMAAAGSDATLSAHKATEPAKVATASRTRGTNSFTLSSAATAGLVTALLIVAFVPLVAYRFMPAGAAVWLDQFSLARKVGVGAFVSNSPSQFGAMVTWTFLWVALLVAILLGLQDNTQRTTELLPPSAAPMADSAVASWQITLRAYTGEDAAAMAVWCRSDNAALISRQSGFSGAFTLHAAVQGQSCTVTADCSQCGVSALASVAFSFPYSAQLIEWELWVNGAQPNSWARRYGVLTQMPGGRLMDAESELRFSVMESYFADERSAAFAPGVTAADKSRSGFELNFLSLSSIQPQPAATLSALSTVTVAFALQKSDVVLESVLSDKQTLLQLGALIASAVVSLFSIFAIGFRMTEAHIFRQCGINTGDVRPVALTPAGKPSEIELQSIEPAADLHVTGGRLHFRALARALGSGRSSGSSRGAADPADPTLSVTPAAASSASAHAESPFSISVAADPPSLADFRHLQRVQPEPSPVGLEPRAEEATGIDGSILPDDGAASEDWHL